MKNLIAVLLCLAVFTGCKKDADADARKKIEGKWYLRRSIIKTYYNGTLARSPFTTDVTGNNNFIQFNSDGTGNTNVEEIFTSVSGTYGTFVYTLSNSNLSIKYEFAKRNGFLDPFDKAVTSLDDAGFSVHYKRVIEHAVAESYYLMDDYYTR